MMLEKQMRKYSILRKIGASSIEKGSRSILDSLKYLVEVIQNPENLFLFFPEGKIKSIYTEEFKFEKGAINYVLKKVTFDFQFVFNFNKNSLFFFVRLSKIVHLCINQLLKIEDGNNPKRRC